jgi:hypothetical protein
VVPAEQLPAVCPRSLDTPLLRLLQLPSQARLLSIELRLCRKKDAGLVHFRRSSTQVAAALTCHQTKRTVPRYPAAQADRRHGLQTIERSGTSALIQNG